MTEKYPLIFKIGVQPCVLAHSQEAWSNVLLVTQDGWFPDALLVSHSSEDCSQCCSSNCKPPHTAHSAEQIPMLPGMKPENKRQQDFPILLPTESGAWALLRQKFICFTLLEVQNTLSTRNSRLSLIVSMLPVQSRKSSFQPHWHDENMYHPILVSTLPPRVYQEQ